MKQSKAIASLAGGTLVVLAACSSTRGGGEDVDVSRGPQAETLGTPDQPTSCGPYFGDAALNPVTGGGNGFFPPPTQFSGHVTEDSPKQNGVLGPPYLTGYAPPYDAHACDTPAPIPTVFDPGDDAHYDAVFLKNWTNADACISVYGFFVPAQTAAGEISIGVYVGPFDPNDISKNVIAHPVGNHWYYHFAFKVPANEVFELVVAGTPQKYTDANGKVVEQLEVTWGFNIAKYPSGEGRREGAGFSLRS